MSHVDAAASDGGTADSGCVCGRARGGLSFALPDIRSATRQSAGGCYARDRAEREGQWASDAYKAYVRSHGKDASKRYGQGGTSQQDPAGTGYRVRDSDPLPELNGQTPTEVYLGHAGRCCVLCGK